MFRTGFYNDKACIVLIPKNASTAISAYCSWTPTDYKHINMDTLWNSSTIIDHPFGRQKAMLDLGLVETFYGMKHHPSDDKIIAEAGVTVEA